MTFSQGNLCSFKLPFTVQFTRRVKGVVVLGGLFFEASKVMFACHYLGKRDSQKTLLAEGWKMTCLTYLPTLNISRIKYFLTQLMTEGQGQKPWGTKFSCWTSPESTPDTRRWQNKHLSPFSPPPITSCWFTYYISKATKQEAVEEVGEWAVDCVVLLGCWLLAANLELPQEVY